jgi:hypothetical protein
LREVTTGDAHLSNLGVFAAPDRRLVFSINDFDETRPGPFEWDVKRRVASFAVAGRDQASTTSSARRCTSRSARGTGSRSPGTPPRATSTSSPRAAGASALRRALESDSGSGLRGTEEPA